MDTALFLPPLRALELGVTGEVVDGVTSDACTVVHPRWAVLPLGFLWSIHFAQSLGEELRATGAADRIPLLRDLERKYHCQVRPR